MDNKLPESLLDLQEALLSAQLRTVRQLKAQKTKKQRPKKGKSMSNIDMAINILKLAHRPLHISEIIAQVKAAYRVDLDRESLVSALVKKVHRNQGVSRTSPNTFLGNQ